MRVSARASQFGLVLALSLTFSLSWSAGGAWAAPLSAQGAAWATAASLEDAGLVHVGARWYPPAYDDEGYSPPARYLPPPVSPYRYMPRKPVVIYGPPPYWLPPTVWCGRRRCVALPQW